MSEFQKTQKQKLSKIREAASTPSFTSDNPVKSSASSSPPSSSSNTEDVTAPENTPTDAMADADAMTSAGDSDSAGGGGIGGGGDLGSEAPDDTDGDSGTTGDSSSILGGASGSGGGGSGFGGGDTSTSDESEIGTEEGEETSPTEDDPVESVAKSVISAAKESESVPNILKALKSGLQYNVSARADIGKIITRLKDENNPVINSAVSRLENFLGGNSQQSQEIKDDNSIMENKKMSKKTLSETEIRSLIRKKILEQQMIKEGSNISAVRALINQASDSALSFENNIVKTLGLLVVDEMDVNSQRIYLDAMEAMKKKIVSAVIDAVRDVENLPKPQEDAKK